MTRLSEWQDLMYGWKLFHSGGGEERRQGKFDGNNLESLIHEQRKGKKKVKDQLEKCF